MTTNSVVKDGYKWTDEQLGRFKRRTDEIIFRAEQGLISFPRAMKMLQDVVEAKWAPGEEIRAHYKDFKEVRDRVFDKDFDLSEETFQIIECLSYPVVIDEEVVLVQRKDLGFEGPAGYEEVVASGLRQGLAKCPPLIFPSLCKFRHEGSVYRQIWVAMDPIPMGVRPDKAEGVGYVFAIEDCPGRRHRLIKAIWNSNLDISNNSWWAFAKPKK